MQTQELMNENETPKRPTSLKVLCILTFISAGLSSISALATPLFSDVAIEYLKSLPNLGEAELNETITVLQAGWGYYLIIFVLLLGSLTGAILMWKLKKVGFHVYSLSNIALLFPPLLMFGIAISWAGILLTASFILLYAVNLKYMK